MKVSGKKILLVVVLVTVNWHSIVAQPDFDKALKEVEKAASQPGNINYTGFCNVQHRGAFKLGCQIGDVPEVGLLVCLKSEDCATRLEYGELSALEIIKDEKLNVVLYDPKIIDKLKCGQVGSTDVGCSGFLVEWIRADKGQWKSLRSEIKKRNITGLVNWVKEYQPNRSAREKTASDLKKIVRFMTRRRPGALNRICDLQGFFMKNGGFKIADPDGVQFKKELSYYCYKKDTYPTSIEVIKALNEMVAQLKMSNSVVQDNSVVQL